MKIFVMCGLCQVVFGDTVKERSCPCYDRSTQSTSLFRVCMVSCHELPCSLLVETCVSGEWSISSSLYVHIYMYRCCTYGFLLQCLM